MTSRRFRCPASRGSAARPAAPRLGLAALALASLALASCWHPAFDPDVSGSEAVIRKLGAPTLRFTALDVEGWEMEDAWFVPVAADLAPLSGTYGLLVRPEVSRIRLHPVTFDTALGQGSLNLSSGTEVTNIYGDRYAVYLAPNGNTDVAVIANLGDESHKSWISPFAGFTSNDIVYPASVKTFGVGFVHDDIDPNQATSVWIGIDLAFQPSYSSPGSWMGGGVPGFGGSNVMMFEDYQKVSRPGVALYTDATGYLYLSCGLSDGSRAIYRWTNPSTQQPTRYPEVYGPLAAALSDGRLLAEKDGIVTVLNPNLERLFSFPAGKLRFVHERWDGSRMISVFTRTLYVRTSQNDDIGRLKVEVYEIPTADLHRLAD